jgi:hypothetical protein
VVLIQDWKQGQDKPFVQSICTLVSSLSGRPDIFLGSGTKQKSSPKYEPQKAGCKKTGSLLFKKRREQAVFLHPAFCKKQVADFFFQGHKLTLVFKTKMVGAD